MLYVVFPPRFNMFPFHFHLRNKVISSCDPYFALLECQPFLSKLLSFLNIQWRVLLDQEVILTQIALVRIK